MTKRKSPKTCTIGLADIRKAVNKFTELTPRRQLSLLRRQAAKIVDEMSSETPAADVRFAEAVGSLPSDPGEGHPCRPLWAYAMVTHYENWVAMSALNSCMLTYPPPPPPPIVT